MFANRIQRRTVHALVRGEIVSLRAGKIEDAERVICNPFLFAGFRRASDGAPVLTAREVILDAEKRIFARGLTIAS